MRRTGTNLPKVGQYNRAVVLDQIQHADGISRVEIAELTGLTPQTVSGIVRRLIDEGIVREDGALISHGGGKPRTRLRINAGAGLAVGVHFDPVQITCVVVDLLGHPLVTMQRPTPPGADPEAMTEAVAEIVSEVLAAAGLRRDQVLGLGLATPGPIDQSLGVLVIPPLLPTWGRVPLKEMLTEATGMPVTLDNDATAAAIGERWAGVGRGVANFAYFFFGAGIGGGLILSHQIHRGGSMNAAEFGHTSVQADGPGCYCGNSGCLESLISPAALTAQLRRRLAAGDGRDSRLAELFRADPATVDYDALRHAAADGDPLAVEIVESAADLLATAVVNVANIVDVDLIVLGGHGLRHIENRFRDAAQHALSTRTLARRIRTVKVELSPLGPDAAVVGAAALVLYATYSPQVSELLSL
ncbi:ROK family transcriptional regulator [Actinoplanes teichomyceticus]|uniref:Putative NBD/HSP70 family sugar kinase n=1 Tax=Actinoplanes teichomyceticus TaxID=1867 RepID=A0A561WB92_ACTTI|nr:ROK family transcriptional regulator [Actinoplanes teichomyceticus]TWG21137.1 putative NBD/HSP70 family sugar kinase [Actinoplanes teichomyceticus]GIF14958.1 sugar kinase [Actinoplanes teichomyceticus]